MDGASRTIGGYIITGRGLAREHIRDEHQSFLAATGEDLIHGSLNVILDEPVFFDISKARTATEGKRLLWQAHLFDAPVWIYRFRRAPLHVVEILSSEHLRTRFELKDYDKIKLSVTEDICVDLTLRQRLAWVFLWKGRKNWSYRSARYHYRTKLLSANLGASQTISDKGILSSFKIFIQRGFR